jgi:predicted amidohydrolase YtcJ
VSELFFSNVEVEGKIVDVRVVDATVVDVHASVQPLPGAHIVEGRRGALLAGLHDHHIHLLATAAAGQSIQVGPRDVGGRAGFAAALREADDTLPPGGWIRAVGYHESVGGDLDRHALDALVPGRPVRVQHRSGARWVLNSAAVEALGIEHADRPGLERDDTGRVTGRLDRSDRWLRELLPDVESPDLAPLGTRLAGYGVTGVTDTTPYTDLADLAPLADAVGSGALPQRVVVTGGPELAGAEPPPGLEWGPVKIVVDDADYPPLDVLRDQVVTAHRHDRSVAIHCVTRTALVLALAAWDDVGARPGDRVEHGSVVPPELRPLLLRHRLTVVTQPGFIGERGDDYRRDVDADDLAHLYPCRSLLDDGVRVAGSTDAPYTDPNPWRAISAAATRLTPSGAVLGGHESVPARRALDLFLTRPHDPGGPARAVVPGAAADLCLLPVPLDDALAQPEAIRVVCTVRDGRIADRALTAGRPRSGHRRAPRPHRSSRPDG